MPSNPPVVYVPPTPGASPAAPGKIFEPAPVGKETLILTGATTAGVAGTLRYAGLINGQPAWSTDGTLTAGASNTLIEYTGTQWKVSRGAVYTALKTSAASVGPEGLLTWTVSPGAGSAIIAAGGVSNPPVVFVP